MSFFIFSPASAILYLPPLCILLQPSPLFNDLCPLSLFGLVIHHSLAIFLHVSAVLRHHYSWSLAFRLFLDLPAPLSLFLPTSHCSVSPCLAGISFRGSPCIPTAAIQTFFPLRVWAGQKRTTTFRRLVLLPQYHLLDYFRDFSSASFPLFLPDNTV